MPCLRLWTILIPLLFIFPLGCPPADDDDDAVLASGEEGFDVAAEFGQGAFGFGDEDVFGAAGDT